jgi:hypothetical protein
MFTFAARKEKRDGDGCIKKITNILLKNCLGIKIKLTLRPQER